MTPKDSAEGAPVWLTPTSASKLIACPASLTSLSEGPRPKPPQSSSPDNAGTLAHLAVQRWVEAGGWREASGTSIADFYTQAAEDHGITLSQLSDGKITRSRLKAQETSLRQALLKYAGIGGSVKTEKTLYDDDNRLWGTVDLLVTGDHGVAVIDLKSGADAAAEALPQVIRSQLLHYALLVRASRGPTQVALAVFSLRRGLRAIEQHSGELRELLRDIDSARSNWMRGVRVAEPSQDHCYFCTQRFVCEPHWLDLPGWEDADAAQGLLQVVEHAANGYSSLTLEHDDRKIWISDVPRTAAMALTPQQLVRAVRLRRSRREIHDVQERETWYATERSAFQSVPQGSSFG